VGRAGGVVSGVEPPISAATLSRIDGSAAYSRPPGHSVALTSRCPAMLAKVSCVPLTGFVNSEAPLGSIP
jgi:hypothetical protein